MKTLLIAVATAGLMLTACSSNKTEAPAQAPQVSMEEAMTQCQQTSQDQATFDACMKDKGFQRKAAAAPADGAASVAPAAPATAQ